MKKILLWTLYAIFVGILIYGAINRTSVKINDESGGQNASSPNAAEREFDQQDRSQSHDDSETDTGEGDGHERITLRGTVTSVSNREMMAHTTDGHQIGIERRAWRFAQEQGFAPDIGNEVVVLGFYDDEQFETIQIVDLATGQSATLRDEDGHSLWSGNSEED